MTNIYVAGLTKEEALAVVDHAIEILKKTHKPSCSALWYAADAHEISSSRTDELSWCYRMHSKAKNGAPGFHDISYEEWDDMEWTDKARLRIERLQAFRQAIAESKWEQIV